MSTASNDVDACLFEALICTHVSCRTDCGCRGISEFLCLRKTYCFEPCGTETEPRTLGFVVNDNSDEIFKVGLFCCDVALIYPRVLVGCTDQTLCLRRAGALPFHKDYVQQPTCALYCVSCYPECGVAKPPPMIPSLERMSRDYKAVRPFRIMDRGNHPVGSNTELQYQPVLVKIQETSVV
jgi:hypothetical protein